MDDRVRSILKDVVLTGGRDAIGRAKESVVSHFFAIYTELHRGLAFGSNTSTIRNTFERAIQSVSGAHCPGLWKDYFYFEYSRRETEKAKAVLRRAVGACPWVKELYLLAFKQLSDDPARGRAELSGMYELIVDKELRVHTALEGSLDEAP